MKKELILIGIFAAVCLALNIRATSVSAQAASEWVENEYVRSRLISATGEFGQEGQRKLMLGWQIELKKEGWKTYWRSPGDAGLPPVFNWEGSINIAEVDVLYPLPERFEIFDIETFGYEHSVIIPIEVTPRIEGAAMIINNSANFMACKDVCIPFVAAYTLDMPVQSEEIDTGLFYTLIRDSLDLVPLKAEGIDALNIEGVSVNGSAGLQTIEVNLKGHRLLTGADIILELPSEFRFKRAQKILLEDGTRARFYVPIVSLPEKHDLRGKTIVLTATDGWGHSFERQIKVDELP